MQVSWSYKSGKKGETKLDTLLPDHSELFDEGI